MLEKMVTFLIFDGMMIDKCLIGIWGNLLISCVSQILGETWEAAWNSFNLGMTTRHKDCWEPSEDEICGSYAQLPIMLSSMGVPDGFPLRSACMFANFKKDTHLYWHWNFLLLGMIITAYILLNKQICAVRKISLENYHTSSHEIKLEP